MAARGWSGALAGSGGFGGTEIPSGCCIVRRPLHGRHRLPGRLSVVDMFAHTATLDRAITVMAEVPVSYLLGCHHEMSSTPGQDHPLGSLSHPDEALCTPIAARESAVGLIDSNHGARQRVNESTRSTAYADGHSDARRPSPAADARSAVGRCLLVRSRWLRSRYSRGRVVARSRARWK